ncbi:MAG: hypothetical protein RLZZ128_1257, partial [Actinomycetota bacterium]
MIGTLQGTSEVCQAVRMIPAAYEDLLTAPNTAILVTLAADGAPHAS